MNSSAKKADHYGWSKPGDKGKFMWIDIDLLEVDECYQRGEVSKATTLAKCREFSWAACGTLDVMQREDDSYVVVDGHQRLLAARNRGDITKLPCIVFRSDGIEHEAAAFKALNEKRNPVRATDKFRSAVIAGMSPESDIAEWLESLKLTVGSRHGRRDRNADRLTFISTVLRFWKLDTATTKAALPLGMTIGNGDGADKFTFVGICYCLRRGIDVAAFKDKLIQAGGITAINAEAARLAIVSQRSSITDVECGCAILNLINKGLRKKLKFGAVKEGQL